MNWPSNMKLGCQTSFSTLPQATALKRPCQLISLAKFRQSNLFAHPAFRQGGRHPRRAGARSSRRQLSAVAASAGGGAAVPASANSLADNVRSFAGSNFIPLGLVAAIVFAWLCPGPGVFAASKNLQTAATIGIFTISGLLLQRGETEAALRSLPALAYGLAAILLVSPLASLGILRLPLQPPEMAVGLAVFNCMPTTLSTCVTLTTAAKGNSAVALLLVVLTNLLAVFTIPVMLYLVLGGSAAAAATFQPLALFRNLVVTVLLPLLAGAAAQAFVPGVQDWRSCNRPLLSYLSALCLCTVPWMQVSKAVHARLPIGPSTVLLAAAAGLGLHLFLLAGNALAMPLVRFSKDANQDLAIRKAVYLCSSQKTLPVAVAVLNQLGGVLGAGVGFAVLPCVAAHLIQTVVDSALVSGWNQQEERQTAELAY